MSADPFVQFKAAQREGWKLFAPLATFTTVAAASLVEFAGVRKDAAVLDIACGTGVVAVTAAQKGARVHGLDLSPVLLDEARSNAAMIDADIEFREGDAEALPYGDAEFDVVLSQFGHMFAPRPGVAVAEMLRVLKPGGRIAFSTWPPELMIGSMFNLTAQYLPPPPGAASPPEWGVPQIVRERLGDAVHGLEFDHAEMQVPALSPRHYRLTMEQTAAPLIKIVESLAGEPQRLRAFRNDLEVVIERFFDRNRVRQSFLMTRAIKR